VRNTSQESKTKSIINNPSSLMNRSKSIVEKKNAISGGVKPAKTVKGGHDK
jgi:hypothetical protein